MKNKPISYKIGNVCGAIFIGTIGLGASALLVAVVIKIFIRMF